MTSCSIVHTQEAGIYYQSEQKPWRSEVLYQAKTFGNTLRSLNKLKPNTTPNFCIIRQFLQQSHVYKIIVVFVTSYKTRQRMSITGFHTRYFVRGETNHRHHNVPLQGGLGACSPRKFLKFRSSEIASGVPEGCCIYMCIVYWNNLGNSGGEIPGPTV